jgi:acetyltransferase
LAVQAADQVRPRDGAAAARRRMMERYPAPWALLDGAPVIIRPIRPDDEPLLVRFHQALSAESVYARYFHLIGLSARVAHERLARVCAIDDDRELALVADRQDEATGDHAILAVGRLSRPPGGDEAEFALLVADGYQGQGLGTALLRRLIEIGREEGLRRVTAAILPDNHHMQHIAKHLGFRLRHRIDEGVVEAELAL